MLDEQGAVCYSGGSETRPGSQIRSGTVLFFRGQLHSFGATRRCYGSATRVPVPARDFPVAYDGGALRVRRKAGKP